MSYTIRPGDTYVIDPADKRVVVFDWSGLAAAAEVSTSTFTIGTIRQNGATALTKDNPSILAGNRSTQVRLDATTATAGDIYTLANAVVTNESPAQTIERQITVLVQNQ
jgi:long-subunit fatty acid transport protein